MNKMEALKKIIYLFARNSINILPIKIYENDEDLDIVLVNKSQLNQAREALKRSGFFLCNNLSKIRETDKDFYCSKSLPYKIHLHRALSWNTIEYLDINKTWKRKIWINDLPIPSPEDEILIIAAHSIFENKYIKKIEFEHYHKLIKNRVDWDYIENVAREFHWVKALNLFRKTINQKQRIFPIGNLFSVSMHKLICDMLSGKILRLPRLFFTYFLVDYFWCYRKAKSKAKYERES